MTSPSVSPAPQWLTLGEASRFLGVDASTLRTWTDAGRVRAFRTPGGHRRYAQDDLVAFVDRSRQERSSRLIDIIGPRATRLIPDASRQQIRRQAWYARLDPKASQTVGQTCQRLMDALVGYLPGGRKQGDYLRQGERLGRTLGLQVAAMPLSPAAATQAFVFFKDAITHGVSTRLPLPAEEKVRSIRRVEAFLDRVLLTMMEAYEQERHGARQA